MGGKLHNFRNKTYSCHLLCIWFNSNLFAEFQKDIDGDYLFTMANLFSTLLGDERLQQGLETVEIVLRKLQKLQKFS